MSDITDIKDVHPQQGKIVSLKMSNVKILEGALVSINSSGYAVNASDTSGDVFAGTADETKDNSGGSAGDLEIRVRVGEVIDVNANFSAAQTNVGDSVYAFDNQTVDLAGAMTNDVLVGKIVEVKSTSKLRVATAQLGR